MSAVGIKLITEIMDHAPRTLTATEWKALIILAEDANDGSRLTFHAVTDEKITNRVGLTAEAWTNLRGVLVRKGMLEIAVPGRRGRAAKYRFPRYAPLGHEIHDPTAMGHGSDDETDVQGHGSHDPSGSMGHESDEETGEYVMGSMTPTPLLPSQPSPPLSPPEARGGGPKEEREDDQAVRKRPHLADTITDAYAKACADAGRPATPGRLRMIRTQVVDILATGEDPARLAQVAAWMGTTNPGWRDLDWARTAPGAPGGPSKPGNVPRPREQPRASPCATEDCHGHNHDKCDNFGRIAHEDGRLTMCPCWEARF